MAKEMSSLGIKEDNVYDESLRRAREAREFEESQREEQKRHSDLIEMSKDWDLSDNDDDLDQFSKRQRKLKQPPNVDRMSPIVVAIVGQKTKDTYKRETSTPDLNRSDVSPVPKAQFEASSTTVKRMRCRAYNKGTCKLGDRCMYEHVDDVDGRFIKTPVHKASPKLKTYSKSKICI